LVNKAVTVGTFLDYPAQIAICDEVISRFGDRTELRIVEQVARAMGIKAVTLGECGDASAEIIVYDELVSRFGDRPETEIAHPR
jgi:hypothetical protein